MPREMNRLILNYFGVKDSLLDLSAKQVQNIINSNIYFSYAQETDYNGKMDNYILSYMLVNFCKIWAPLYQLLKKGCLKKDMQVLELGAGPGTATLSLWYFYILLASDNPNIKFHLHHTIADKK